MLTIDCFGFLFSTNVMTLSALSQVILGESNLDTIQIWQENGSLNPDCINAMNEFFDKFSLDFISGTRINLELDEMGVVANIDKLYSDNTSKSFKMLFSPVGPLSIDCIQV